jgi:hypothetical protein
MESKRATFALAAGSTTNGASNGMIVESNAEAFHALIMQAFANESTKKGAGPFEPRSMFV